MKKILTVATLAFILAFKAAPETFTADSKTSIVHWLGKKATGQHDGFVGLKRGMLLVEAGVPLNGEFTLDMNTLTCADIKDKVSNKSLIEHLKNEDFFNVAKFPEATLMITKFAPLASQENSMANYTATALLTIKGITNEISFPVAFSQKEATAKATATITVDRTKWNIVYKSKTIFSTIGDKFIYDDITFDVDLTLKK